MGDKGKSMKTHTLKISSAKLAAAAILGAAILLFMGCYYVPGLSGSKARAGLVLPRSLVANPISLALIVGGPGMEPIFASYTTIPPSISIEVPSGLARTFTVLLNGPSATLQGVATVDLQPGETEDITVSPTVAGTQIVVPDFQNARIVQISDMTGAAWIQKHAGDFSAAGDAILAPYAVDFDNQGRIYVANNCFSTNALGGIFRFDDINHTSSFEVVDSTNLTITMLAVDRAHGLVYYGNGSSTIYVKDVGNIAAGPTPIDLSLDLIIAPIKSMAVDDQGILYIAVPTVDFAGYVVKYDPSAPPGSRAIARSTNSTYAFSINPPSTPWGVMVKGSYVYVCDSGAGKIVRFDKNLQFVDSFPGPSTDLFYGPEAFVATLNRKITVIDEKSGWNDRLASFDDMTGAGWTTFGFNGNGINTFDFYSQC